MQNKTSLFILLSAAGLAGFFWLKDFIKLKGFIKERLGPWPVSKKNKENQPLPVITLAIAQMRDFSEALSVTGLVAAGQSTSVGNGVAGTVEAIHFESGQPVKQGDPLVSLDARIEKALLQELKAQAALAEEAFKRCDAKTDGDRSRLETDAARARVETQQARVEKTLIRAPFDGVLGLRQVTLGQYLPVGSPLVTLSNLDRIQIDLTLPKQHIGQVAAGQAVTARLEDHPWQAFPGLLQAVVPEIHRETRHFAVRAIFANPDHALIPGLTARIEWSLSTPERRVMIPKSAVLDGTGTVFVVEAISSNTALSGAPRSIVKRREIRLGSRQSDGDLVVVLEGLQVGERVATSNLQSLQDGAEVEVIVDF